MRRLNLSEEETRALILENAYALFNDVGFNKTTIADIAKACGFSSANVHKYFGTKSAINQAINAYSPVFKMARCMAVYHTAPIPAGCSEPPRDSDFQLDGSEVCVGIFRQPQGDDADKAVGNTESGFPSTEYLLVVNRDAFKERTAGLEFKDVTVKVRRMDKSTGKWIDEEAATSAGISVVNVKLEPGSGELYEVVRTKP